MVYLVASDPIFVGNDLGDGDIGRVRAVLRRLNPATERMIVRWNSQSECLLPLTLGSSRTGVAC